jgi:hypothetical protein
MKLTLTHVQDQRGMTIGGRLGLEDPDRDLLSFQRHQKSLDE